MKPYRLLDEAFTELADQAGYFDEQVAGLGDKFIADVEATIRDIREYPRSGPLRGRYRKRVLRVFKHSVFYVDRPGEIIIVAVAPHKRRPSYWRGRSRNLPR